MYTKLRNVRTNKVEYVPVDKVTTSTVAFPGEMRRKSGIGVLRDGRIQSVSRRSVDYEVPSPLLMYSPATNLVPMLESLQGNRKVMGAKMSTQALPLVTREQPWIQVATTKEGRSFEDSVAKSILPTSPVDGIVAKVDKDYIYIRPTLTKKSSTEEEVEEPFVLFEPVQNVAVEYEDEDGTEKTAAGAPLIKIPYENNFPLASKTYLHNNLLVKKGDKVRSQQPLAGSNFTKDNGLALGKNLRVGYLAYYGNNSNDAVVISQAASEKLTSEHMYKELLLLDSNVTLNKRKYRAQFPNRWTAAQYDNLDDDGVAKKGAVLNPEDPAIVALRKAEPTADSAMLGRLHKTLSKPYREENVIWSHKAPGKVVDVIKTSTRAIMTVKTQEQAGIGDKLAGRYGNKGVISKIIPNDQMVQTPDGKPVDVLMTSAGIISRVNPAQIIEVAAAKVAEKTGKRILVPSLSGRNNVKWARNLLKKHGISDKEILYNPVSGKKIKGPDGKGVMVGPQYIYKLFKSTDTNFSERGIESYDVNRQPTKGGIHGAKSMGRMELNALIAHGARGALQEAALIKGTKNDDFWRSYQLGLPTRTPTPSFAYNKFNSMLQGAGVNVSKEGNKLYFGPMTDADITEMSSGKITKATMLRDKDLKPERGGLFDPVITGGSSGDRWSHVALHEPVVNPTFEEPVRRLLGYTQKELRNQIGSVGGAGIRKQLRQMDTKKKERELRATIRTGKGSSLDNAVKQLKYLQTLKKRNLTPDKAYTLSKLIIVPPTIRPILPSKSNGELLIADANYLYRDNILANNTLQDVKKTQLPEEIGRARLHLYDSTRATFGLAEPLSPQLKQRQAKGFISMISGQGSPKRGFFHGKLLKLPQNLSGRGTAVPDLTLGIDEVGIPEKMLWGMYRPHITKGLVQKGYRAVETQDLIDDKHPAAREVLLNELKRRPVQVNRAPSLHRFNITGAYAVPVPGKTIRVNPFIEQGQNLDYDGDTLQIHVPVTDRAVEETKRMTLSNTLFSDRSKNSLLVAPQHEAIVGLHLASKPARGGRTITFQTQKEALGAYSRGDISFNDKVRILHP